MALGGGSIELLATYHPYTSPAGVYPRHCKPDEERLTIGYVAYLGAHRRLLLLTSSNYWLRTTSYDYHLTLAPRPSTHAAGKLTTSGSR